MLIPTTPVLEIVARVVLIYGLLLVLVEDTWFGAALVAAATLLGLSMVVGRLTYWSPVIEAP